MCGGDDVDREEGERGRVSDRNVCRLVVGGQRWVILLEDIQSYARGSVRAAQRTSGRGRRGYLRRLHAFRLARRPKTTSTPRLSICACAAPGDDRLHVSISH